MVTNLSRGEQFSLLVLLILISFFMVLTSAMYAPLLIVMAEEFRTSVAAMGQMATVNSAMWATLAFFAGPLSDRYGRRSPFALGTALVGLGILGASTASDYWTLLACRTFAGVGAGIMAPNIFSSAGEYFSPEGRGRVLARIQVGHSLAGLVGVPLLALAAYLLGWRWATAITGLLMLTAAVMVWLLFPRGYATDGARKGVMASYAEAFQSREAMALIASNLVERIGQGAFNTYLAAYVMQTYGLGLDGVSPVVSAVAAGGLAAGLVAALITDRLNKAHILYSSQICTGLLALPLMGSAPGVVITAGLATALGAIELAGRPSFIWMCSEAAPRARGVVMGFYSTSNQFGMALGAALGAVAIQVGGFSSMGVQICAAMLLASLIVRLGARGV